MVTADVAGSVVQAGVITGDIHLPPPHPLPRPRQLPAAPPAFVGRTAELATLTTAGTASARGTVLISALAGAGGMGKTCLALHWAQTHLDRFPDGQLFVDLRGFSPENKPVEPLTAVREFLDALGVDPARLSGDLAEDAALYRSLVAGKQMLIVLDNAASADQVAPLLPGTPTCTVIVTSRKTLTALISRYGARHLLLDILGEHEAHALLVHRLGEARVAAEPAAATELIRLCGRYPLALTIMASRAQARPHLLLAEFASELRESGLAALADSDPLASLPSVLSWSLQGLTAEQREVFALLGLAPGAEIGLPAAVSLTALPVQQVRTALRGLEEASLLERHAHYRYAMHDLIRNYAATTARQELAEDIREAALRRVCDFYTHTAHAAACLLAPHRPPVRLDPPAPGASPHPLPDDPAAVAWFDAEHPNLLAAQHTAIVHRWYPTVWQLAWALTNFHARRARRHDELAVWRAALEAVGHLPDPTMRTRARRSLGRAYANLGRYEEAIGHLRQALDPADHPPDLTEQAHTHRMLAWVWDRRGDGRRALNHAIRALDLFRSLDQPAWKARALNNVGWCAARLGEYDTARVHCQAAHTLHQRHHDTDGEADTQDSLGYIEHHTGHHRRSIDHYQQALTLFRALGNIYASADTLDNLGHPYVASGQHDQARTVWRQALELYRQQGRTEDAERVQRQLNALDHPDSG